MSRSRPCVVPAKDSVTQLKVRLNETIIHAMLCMALSIVCDSTIHHHCSLIRQLLWRHLSQCFLHPHRDVQRRQPVQGAVECSERKLQCQFANHWLSVIHLFRNDYGQYSGQHRLQQSIPYTRHLHLSGGEWLEQR